MLVERQERPLRVLHFICSTGFYGAEKWILALANNTDRREIESELVVTQESENKDLLLTSEFRQMGLKAHELPMNGRFDIRVISSLVSLIKERKIDVVHTHGYKSDIIGVIASKMTKTRCVSTPHGFETTDDWKLHQFIRLGCHTFRFFDKVAPLSVELCNDVKKYGVSEDNITYIRNGVDLKSINFRRPSSIRSLNDPNNSSRTIGFIGQLIGRKNVRDLLDIFNNIASKNNNIKLVLLGDGDSRVELEAYASDLPVSNQIEFLGFQTQPLKYLEKFDLFVMTSSLEGIPRCLMESMAMGVPVAAYNIPGVDQLIEHGSSGLLADLGDKTSLEEHWNQILWNNPVADDIAIQASDDINRKFSAKRMAQEYTVLYNDLFEVKRTKEASSS